MSESKHTPGECGDYWWGQELATLERASAKAKGETDV